MFSTFYMVIRHGLYEMKKSLLAGKMFSLEACPWLIRFKFSILLSLYTSPTLDILYILSHYRSKILEFKVDDSEDDEVEGQPGV